MALRRERMRLGDLLIKQNVLTEDELKKALELQKGSGKKIGEVLVDNGFITEDMIVRALQMQLGLKVVQLTGVTIPKEVRGLVSVDLLKKYTCIPFELDPYNANILHLAMADPMDMAAIDDISIVTNLQVEPYIASTRDVLAAIDRCYGASETLDAARRFTQERAQLRGNTADEDDSGDLVVWYCLGDKDNKTGNGYYAHSPNDVRNNYYIYSYKNIIYTGVGHKPVTDNGNLMEKKLFVNTIIAAYNAQAVNPELMFVKQSDRNAAQEKTVYYTLDNVNFNESQELIKNKPLEFHLKVTDSNLVGTSFAGTNTKDLKLQLYIESDNGTKFEGIGGENTNVVPIDVPVYEAGNKDSLTKDSNGCIYVNSGKVYNFTLNDLPDYENYLKTSAGYKGKVTLYAKISCKYIYYGTEKEAQSVAQINICQRQLFDLD